MCICFGIGCLLFLLGSLTYLGASRLELDFLLSFPSRIAENAGILSAWVGSLCVLIVTFVFAVPIGIAAAIYLEEYSRKTFWTQIVEISISNLAGVTSIVFGLLALGLFVYRFGLGTSILTGGLTLGLLVLPVIIVASREAIRAVPQGLREAAFALGATRWQVVLHHVLPASRGGMITGIIIAFSRAIGETAPLVTIGALTFIAFLPSAPITAAFPFVSFAWLKDPFTVMPVQMFNWTSRPQEEFQINAAAAGVVLVALALFLNFVAIVVRYRTRKNIQW